MEKEKTARAYRMDKADRVVGMVFTVLTWFSIVAVVFILAITVVNVISRAFFTYPIFGTIDVSSVVLSLVAMCALPIVTMFNTHIKVDLVADRLPEKVKDILICANLVMCTVIMTIMSRTTFTKAGKVQVMGTRTGSLAIPLFPVYYLISFMLLVSALCALYNLFHFLYCGNTIGTETFIEINKRLSKTEGDNTQ